MPKRCLVMGFGNMYRRDDGVAFYVINGLRQRLGRPVLTWEADGFDDLGHEVDTVVLHQLVPEMAEAVSAYDLVIFVDAHVNQIETPVLIQELDACYKESTVPHQLHPCSILAMAHELYDSELSGLIVSVRGHDFDFGDTLSEPTQALLPQAIETILENLKGLQDL